MDSSYISIIIFIIITIFYYVLKPALTIEILQDTKGAAFGAYSKTAYMVLFVYFLASVLSQFGVNASIIIDNCGGSMVDNIGAAALITFIPWIFIFGALMGILIVFPGFKSAFSNVIGYFAVSGQANALLTELLVNADISKAIDVDSAGDTKKQLELQSAADAIIKLCGNMSILINQIVPDNFEQYWGMLTPLMKPAYPTDIKMKQKLLDLVIMRDNIGEALWYIYTAILITSITQYQIVSRGCVEDSATMEAKHAAFVKGEDAIKAEQKKNSSATYTIG